MSSSSITSGGVGERGVPSKCACGLDVKIFTSKTQENPGRPFFRCVSKRDVNTWTSKRDWVEDAVFEEVQDALPRLSIIANEISKIKAEVNEIDAMARKSEDLYVRLSKRA
ncbi:PREDICTED: uncharacterized protein At1g43920, Chloroplastic-like [Camelina sativa]|uniref:Uncharacterized protein At1g43920, Chloroplastic-like n=1 Tax=Camelina sativa TaxID=90675 RepID=A0ABM1R9V0_CAMSA|nr:PREDICTED: uncharacterized protein At1g43920, Chloroplastic-like [Camelina sativa]